MCGSNREKLRAGRGGVWRHPPKVGGSVRAPLPRFTTLTPADRRALYEFFLHWGRLLHPVLVPGSHVVVASNTLVSHIVAGALTEAGLEQRGIIARRVQTLRGGDRPKNGHEEFPNVSVMPRSQWEPWLVLRRPIEGRVVDNLRKYRTGGLRRPTVARPFGDVIESARTSRNERSLASHPSLKPQAFLRRIVYSVLPLGEGTVADLFAGSGSTLAAAESVGYRSVGGWSVTRSILQMAGGAIPRLARMEC